MWKHTFVTALLVSLPALGDWNHGDEISNPTNWASVYQAMRARSVMNMHNADGGPGNDKWFGANFYLSATTTNKVLPDIDPIWWSGETNGGGWVVSAKFSDTSDYPALTRTNNFATGNGQHPYIDWYVYEMQTQLQRWFGVGRFRWPDERMTNWDGSTGGSNMTLSVLLAEEPDITDTNVFTTYTGDTFDYSNGARRTWEMTNEVTSPRYIFTNGWAQSGDFMGFWQRDDMLAILQTYYTNPAWGGWYTPDKDASDYAIEDANQLFVGHPDERHESIPLYMRSGSYERIAEWSYSQIIGTSTNYTAYVVTNTASPECDGEYNDWAAGADYTRWLPPTPAASLDEVAELWIIYGQDGPVWVSGSGTAGDGEYTFYASPTNTADTYYAFRGVWEIINAGSFWYVGDNFSSDGFTNSALEGTYTGYGSYSGLTATVTAAFFYRPSVSNVVGLYENFGSATSDGTAEVQAGDGWVDWVGYSNATAVVAQSWVTDNWTNVLATNLTAMTMPTAAWNTYSESKGGHDRRFAWSVAEETFARSNIITVGFSEYNKEYSPGCIVAHKFGDGDTVAASHGLPTISEVNLFIETGYLTTTTGCAMVGGELFPYVPFDLIRFDGTNKTYLQYLFQDDGSTPSQYPDLATEYRETTNFVGWTMKFEFAE